MTNPDMLHSAILPHHTKWFQLFEQLRVIVIDELHTYRGVFGSHVANVLRRLLRLCAHYGSNPIIVCCSATIGNPAELAAQLTGRPPRLIDRNGAPAGEKHVLLVDPPLLDPATGRPGLGADPRPALGAAVPARRAPDDRVRAGARRGRDHADSACARRCARTSGRGRGSAATAAATCPPSAARSSAGCATARSSASCRTNALELGVDIGAPGRRGPRRLPGLDRRHVAADGPGRPARDVSVGDPRRVAGSPVDQYVIHHPEFLLDGQPEEARLDPDNLHVLLAHLRCATFELPFEPGELFGPGPGGRPARVPRRGGPRPPGGRRPLVLELGELPGLGGVACGRPRRRTS